MLSVTVSVNGHRLHTVEVQNLGPPPGVEDVAGGTGLRRYRWRSYPDGSEGEVLHLRGDGATALAIAVLMAASE